MVLTKRCRTPTQKEKTTMTKQYSKVYTNEAKTKSFRYNYKECVLEYVSFKEYIFDEDDNYIETKMLKQPEVIDSIGLSKSEWTDGEEYYVEMYSEELNAEMEGEMAFM